MYIHIYTECSYTHGKRESYTRQASFLLPFKSPTRGPESHRLGARTGPADSCHSQTITFHPINKQTVLDVSVTSCSWQAEPLHQTELAFPSSSKQHALQVWTPTGLQDMPSQRPAECHESSALSVPPSDSWSPKCKSCDSLAADITSYKSLTVRRDKSHTEL